MREGHTSSRPWTGQSPSIPWRAAVSAAFALERAPPRVNTTNTLSAGASDSFTVGENGITFYYQPYDVAPYVFGVIEITVPWEELH